MRAFSRLSSSISVAGGSLFADDVTLSQNVKLFMNGAGNNDFIEGIGTNKIQFKTNNALRMELGATSYLHGSWTAVSATLSSDARLKQDIVPLYKTLASLRKSYVKAEVDVSDPLKSVSTTAYSTDAKYTELMNDDMKQLSSSGSMKFVKDYNTTMMVDSSCSDGVCREEMAVAVEMLNELRPVSYFMKTNNNIEAKNLRFGFLAQEIEKVLPSLVKTDEDKNNQKSLFYSDIIAIMTMALQHELHLVQELTVRVDDHEERLISIEERLSLENSSLDREERIKLLEQQLFELKQQLHEKQLLKPVESSESVKQNATAKHVTTDQKESANTVFA
jgi:hypothetical protein